MIPAEAVEAAAKAESERDRPGMWEHESEQSKDALRCDARLHLEAAAPHMPLRRRFVDPNLTADLMAKAWDEGYDHGRAGELDTNPYRSEA